MKGILTILVLLLVSAGAFAPVDGAGRAWAGDLPDGAMPSDETGKSGDMNQGINGDPTDAGDGHGADDNDPPIDDVAPLEFKASGAVLLGGLFDLLMTTLPLLP